MLYAVVDQSGDLIARDLTTEQAAHEILTVDGQEYEMRRDPEGYWSLWTRQQVANRPWTCTLLGSWGQTEDDAKAEVFADALRQADGGRHWMAEAIPQDEYDAMMARLAAEADA